MYPFYADDIPFYIMIEDVYDVKERVVALMSVRYREVDEKL